MESDSCQETIERMSQPAYRIYTNKVITWVTFLGSPIAGSVLAAHNFRKWGEAREARIALVAGFATTALFLLVAFLIPEEFDPPTSLFTVPQLFLVSWAVHIYQGQKITTHLDSGGKKGSFLAATGIGLCFTAVLVGLFLGSEALYYQQFGTVETFYHGDEVYYKDGASAEDARVLAEALKEIGWFGDSDVTSAQITKADSHFVVSIMLADGAWEDSALDDYFQQMADDLAALGMGTTLELRLCDGLFKHKRTVHPDVESKT